MTNNKSVGIPATFVALGILTIIFGDGIVLFNKVDLVTVGLVVAAISIFVLFYNIYSNHQTNKSMQNSRMINSNHYEA